MVLIVGQTENSGYLGSSSSSSLYYYSLKPCLLLRDILIRRRPYDIKPVPEMTMI
jgi:hypothetical protein